MERRAIRTRLILSSVSGDVEAKEGQSVPELERSGGEFSIESRASESELMLRGSESVDEDANK